MSYGELEVKIAASLVCRVLIDQNKLHKSVGFPFICGGFQTCPECPAWLLSLGPPRSHDGELVYKDQEQHTTHSDPPAGLTGLAWLVRGSQSGLNSLSSTKHRRLLIKQLYKKVGQQTAAIESL